MSQEPVVSVVIPAYNVADTLGACIESILAQDWPKDALEVLVVDNGSRDGSLGVARGYPVRLLDEGRRGRSVARNRGVRESRGSLLAFIDADCEAPPSWLRDSVAAWQRPWVGGVQARVRKHGAPSSSAGFGQANYYRPFLDTCALLSSRQAYDDARGFDEELRRNVDMDYSFRLLACGYAFAWLPQTTVIKHHDLTPRQVLRRGWDGGLSVSTFTKKWRSVYPSSTVRIWADRGKAWAHGALTDLSHPLQGRGRHLTEATVKLLACAVTDLTGGFVAESRFEPRAPVRKVLGQDRSLVIEGQRGLVFDAAARTVQQLDERELLDLVARIDAVAG